jgi:predicted small secreted protein
MAKGMLVFVIMIVAAVLLAGCETAKGLKGDVQFIGDKTYEIVDK